MNLRELDFTRCLNLTDDSITSLANLHGARLEKLSLNGLDELTETSVRTLISACSEHLRDIDVSFVRAVNIILFLSILPLILKFVMGGILVKSLTMSCLVN